jgi:anaerobic magnesium-protoporphyrin IX monomethyl ester cyclase
MLSRMRILLLSMPDSFEHTPSLAMRMPNGGLASIAGNVDAHHDVAIADLILAQGRVRETVETLVRRLAPDLVGLSVMTFQRRTALALVQLIRRMQPQARFVVGGYDPSLALDAYELPEHGIDFAVRGEGDLTFRSLVRALERGGPLSDIPGLSFRRDGRFRHNPPRPVNTLDDGDIALPRRAARVLSGYTFLGRPIDVVETSRGCTYDCSFCSIIEMRGRNFHRYTFDRVLADIADARSRGARMIFIVDDNITLNVRRFEALCKAIVAAGLNDIHYIVQAMTSSIADHGATLAPVMRAAGFRYVFLGIENVLEEDLTFLKAGAKNARREHGRTVGNASLKAIEYLHQHHMYVVGGIIVGNPDDRRESIEANLEFARRYVDWPYIQHPTPYPGTPMTKDFAERDLIVNDRLEEYDGTTAVVRTRHMTADDVEFLRWRAERWMKVRHMPAVLRHYPTFVLRNGRRMLAHTFRGSSWRSMLGLERDRDVFRRYKSLRASERDYLGAPMDDAPLHDETDRAQRRNVLRRIPVDGDQVSEQPLLHAADPILHVQHARRE